MHDPKPSSLFGKIFGKVKKPADDGKIDDIIGNGKTFGERNLTVIKGNPQFDRDQRVK